MMQMIQQVVRLEYHLKKCKRACNILQEKVGKLDVRLVKSYKKISLLNYIGKLLEKVVAEQLLQLLENVLKLYQGQMVV